MSRLLQCGFETGVTTQLGTSSGAGWASANPTIISASPAARSGTYALKCGGTATAATGFSRQTFSHASQTEAWYGFAVYRSNTGDSSTFPADICWHNLDSAGNVNLVLTLEEDGSLRLYYANAGGGAPTSAQLTLIGTSSVTIPAATWNWIDIHFAASTSTTGTAELYVESNLAYSNTATRTCQTNANTTSFALEFWRVTSPGSAVGDFFVFDDLVVNTTAGSVNNGKPGSQKIVLLTPTGAGHDTQLTKVGSAASNWQSVNTVPVPATPTNFVESTTVGQHDEYTVTSPPTLPTGAATALNYIVYGANSDAGGGSVEPTFYTESTLNQQSGHALSTSWQFIQQILENNPVSASAWSQSDLNALQIGETVA